MTTGDTITAGKIPVHLISPVGYTEALQNTFCSEQAANERHGPER